MKNKLILTFCLFGCLTTAHVPLNEKGERHMVIVTASYNNLHFFKKNLDSVASQKYDNYHIVYLDDCSSDGMSNQVRSYLKKNKQFADHVLYIRNSERICALPNQYRAIHLSRDTDVIVMLDGDDWFINNDVLSFVNSIYQDQNIWMTYGQFKDYPSGAKGFCVPVPDHVIKNNGFRTWVHAPSHLKTFYAGLFHQIQKEDLCDEEGNFFTMTGDLAKMLPIIEMARNHFKFIPDMLMVYNYTNPISDHKVSVRHQSNVAQLIRSRPPYQEVKTPFWLTEFTDEKN